MNANLKSSMPIAVCVLLVFPLLLSAGEVYGMSVSHYEPLQRMNISHAASTGPQDVSTQRPVTLTFDALGTEFRLQLEPNDSLLSAASLGSLGTHVQAYRGQLEGVPDSWVRIVVSRGVPAGLIWDGNELFAIERPGDSAVSATDPIIYRLADAYMPPGTMSCGSATGTTSAATTFHNLVEELSGDIIATSAATEELRIGVAGDFEFSQWIGDMAAEAIIDRFNNIDGIYSEQLGIQIRVAELEVFTTASDPFTDESDPGLLLGEVSTYRMGNPAQAAQGLTHLYTGRDLAGSVVGLAYSGSLCSTIFGAGLSEGRRGTTTDSLITAHEIGHNFGAPHDGEAGSPCASVTGDWLMTPGVTSADQFSSCSIDQMQDDIAAAACIQPLPSVDVLVRLAGTAPTILLGETTDLTFDIDNIGTSAATNVVADFTLPGNLTLSAALPTSGSCNIGTGTASCNLGDVPASSSRSVVITAAASAVGTGTVHATVSADEDADPGNNAADVDVVVDPAVDLAITNPSSTSVVINQNIAVSATISNLSGLEATGVMLAATLDTGLQPAGASWSVGNCTISSQQIECTADSLAAGANATISIEVTGAEIGTQSFEVSVSSTEADTVPSNNSATGTVEVTPGTVSDPPSQSSSGGGMLAPLFLGLLAALVLVRLPGAQRRCGCRKTIQKARILIARFP